jgi:tetratricopeptide (TPR) repeat protein
MGVAEAKERTEELGGISSPEAVSLGRGALLADRYQIEASIGEGGSGQVFRAWDRVIGEPVALKILRPDRARDRSWVKRLAREVKVARAIRHPNVCRVFELGHAGGHWFITMELAAEAGVRGRHRAPSEASRSLAQRLDDAGAVAAGLAAIHAAGIVHRDVTPQNVLRMDDGRLVLSDFGLAIEVASNTTMDGGTPSYMPPETAMGARADQRSDVWQLGAILHEILFDRRPEWDATIEGMALRWPVRPGATAVEVALGGLVRDCLAMGPAARPASAVVVVDRLAAAERPRRRSAARRLVDATLAGLSRRRALVGGLLAVLAAGEMALGVSAWRERRRGEAIDRLHHALAVAGHARGTGGQLARDLNGVAGALAAAGRGEDALAYVDRAVAGLRDELGPTHPLVGIFLANRGEVLESLGRPAEARAAFEQSIAIEEQAYGARGASLAFPLAGFGESLLAAGRAREAVGPLERALAIRREEREPDRAPLADNAFGLAEALWAGGGDRARARRLALEALDLDRELGRATAVRTIEGWLDARLEPPARQR